MNTKLSKLSAVLIVFFMGCAAQPQMTPEQRDAVPNFERCYASQPQGKKASCAMDLYGVMSRLPDSDYAKGPGLNFATNLYILLTKVDRGQIQNDKLQIEWMKINNQTTNEMQLARQRNAEQIRQESAARQQYWINVQRAFNQSNQQPVYMYQNNSSPPQVNTNGCSGMLSSYGSPCWNK
jgi:hypothetical protein